ncbi:hypothetical protein FSP39_009356 [Pinctada imbricata]|uniref:Uncharacterized protein n=1 Tax=Pinctada imbricata TaxID=66713 RepID=A0AA88XLL5_PINIB|nr:hypothetical protein FSP39_009356 [Pinctada imbricata]
MNTTPRKGKRYKTLHNKMKERPRTFMFAVKVCTDRNSLAKSRLDLMEMNCLPCLHHLFVKNFLNKVEEAVKLNKDLTYINQHQKCIVSKQESDIHELQAKLVEVKGQLKNKQDQNAPLLELQQQVTTLKHKLTESTDAYTDLQLEERASKEKYEDTLSNLEESHRLLERHIENAEKYRKEIDESEKNNTCLQEEVSKLKEAVDDTTKALDIEKNLHAESLKEWKEQEDKWKKAAEDLEAEVSTQKQINADLEELNTNWSKQNVELTKDLKHVKALLNKPKEEKQEQTLLSLLNMFDTACQIKPDVNTREVQVEGPLLKPVYCQTFVPVTVYASSQTLHAPTAQTMGCELHNAAIQTDTQERKFTQSPYIMVLQTECPEDASIRAVQQASADVDIMVDCVNDAESSYMQKNYTIGKYSLEEKNGGKEDPILTIEQSQTLNTLTEKLESVDTKDQIENKSNDNYSENSTSGEESSALSQNPLGNERCDSGVDAAQTEASTGGNNMKGNQQSTVAITEISINNEVPTKVEQSLHSSVVTGSASGKEEAECLMEDSAEKLYKTQASSDDKKDDKVNKEEEDYLKDVLNSSRKYRHGRTGLEEVQGVNDKKVTRRSTEDEGSTSVVRESPSRAKLKLLGHGKSRTAHSCLPVADASPLRKSFTLPSSSPARSPVRIDSKLPDSCPMTVPDNMSQSILSDFAIPAVTKYSQYRASMAKSPVRSSPRRSQLPVLVKPSSSNRKADKSGYEDMKNTHDEHKRVEGILKDIDIGGKDQNKKSVTFGLVMQRDYERSPEPDDLDPNQSVVADSDDEEASIANKYKRTIQQIMRKSQAKKMKME